MCGGFTCSKNALIALNVLYIVVACILIGVAVYGREATILDTDLPIVGGILACGIILMLISVLGLLGAVKHHQVMLFFYMVILFLLFLIQFSVACACLGVNNEQQTRLAEEGWKRVNNNTRSNVQKVFSCCGFDDKVDLHYPPPDFQAIKDRVCPDPAISDCQCSKCVEKVQNTINYAFKLCGWIGLFFSFSELVGLAWTRRYRNLHDPDDLRATAVFPRHNFTY
ncbi:tetraspanin-31-A isoform X1 [Diabrotica undecimpunctata]|uniref:tetraspanin-31-A isoform X1 n=1 Tax=Diabrotica undecimpunctata TaxID=50387 RepID=UPI003B63BE31